MNSSERLEELFSEVHQARWDVILISETWRQGKEVWETQQGHIVVESSPTSMESLSYLTKGVEIRSTGSNARANEWLQHRSVKKQPIILVSVYMPHSGYPDHQVEQTYKKITTAIENDKSMKIIGGDFNAELGPGEGIELSSVGQYTLKKSKWKRWMDDTVVTWKQSCRIEHDVQENTAETGDLPCPERCEETAGLHLDWQKTSLLEQRRGGQRHNWHGKRPQMCYGTVRNS